MNFANCIRFFGPQNHNGDPQSWVGRHPLGHDEAVFTGQEKAFKFNQRFELGLAARDRLTDEHGFIHLALEELPASVKDLPNPPDGPWGPSSATPEAKARFAGWRPVTYTHLTLPTIYSE